MKHIFLASILIMLNISAFAAVTASVDRNQIVIGESFNLMITVDENTSEQPDLSDLQAVFNVLGSSQSSSTKIINGNYSVEKTWQIALTANGVGNHTIPPIKVGNDATQPIQITVSKSDPNAKANGDIFIEVQTDKDTAFVKEQILLTVKLFYVTNLLSEGNLSEPIFPNALLTQLDKGANYTTNIKGRNYTVAERHYALFAEKSGTLEMNPIIFNGRDNSSRRNFSMFSTGKPVRAVSEPLTLEIKPIPQNALGQDWIPASKVQISQEWSKEPFTVGEPITRTITLYIEGLSETQIPEIELGEIDNIRVYPEQPQTQTEKTPQTVKAWKQVKLALIPTQAGAIRIPEYSLQWYNVNTDSIEYARLPPMTIQVDAGEFAMEKPEVNIMQDQVVKPKAKDSVAPLQQQPQSIKVIEKASALWKVTTAIFALLWVLTLGYFLIKGRGDKVTKSADKAPNISKSQLLKAIESESMMTLQQQLLVWWNQQYPDHQVNNLGQIRPMVSLTMQQLIDQLGQQLYSNQQQSFDHQAWMQQVKGKGLHIVKTPKLIKSSSSLPQLY